MLPVWSSFLGFWPTLLTGFLTSLVMCWMGHGAPSAGKVSVGLLSPGYKQSVANALDDAE